MFTNILKWSFKVAIGEIEKEFHLHLDNDSPIEAIEQVAIQMLQHCGKVKEIVKQQQDAQRSLEEQVKVEEPSKEEVIECPVQN